MIKNFSELESLLQSRQNKPNLGVVCAHDMHTLEAIKEAVDKGLISAVLIGKQEIIEKFVEDLAIPKDAITIIASDSDEESAAIGVALVRNQRITVLMKGKIQTKDFLKAVVNSETGIKESEVLSHFSIHEIPTYHKILAITDGGMVLYPNLEEKKAIVKNAVTVFKRLGYETSKVAALAAVEVVNPKMQETVDAAALKLMDIPGCILEGPISYDLAFSKESARIKGYTSDIVGDADILLVPNIATGNILSKALIYSAGARMAGIIIGAKVPIVLTSRGASADEKYYSIVLGTLYN